MRSIFGGSPPRRAAAASLLLDAAVDVCSPQRRAVASASPSFTHRKGGSRARSGVRCDGQPQLPARGVALSLAESHPRLAAQWSSAGTNGLVNAKQVDARSTKLIEWRCHSCGTAFKRRVRDHVATKGECPSCHATPNAAAATRSRVPAATTTTASKGAVSMASMATAAAVARAGPEPDRDVSGSCCDALEAGKAIDPMLAQPWSQWAHVIPEKEELLISPKLDGIRCIVGWDSAAQAPVFLSRKGKVFECADHLVPFLRPLFVDDPTLVLDGELYNHALMALDFDLLTSAVRTTRTKRTPEVEAVQRQLQYHIFDIMHSRQLAPGGRGRGAVSRVDARFAPPSNSAVTPGVVCDGSGFHVPFSDRYKLLKGHFIPRLARATAKLLARRGGGGGGGEGSGSTVQPPIVLVPHVASSRARIDADLQAALARNYEGVMIRRKGAGYAFGKRSPFLLKHKVMHDAEFEIIDFVQGNGKWEGSLGAMVCRTKSGAQFTVSPSVTEKMRQRMWRRKTEYVGKMLTVRFQQLGANGVPRFPIGKGVRGLRDGSDWV